MAQEIKIVNREWESFCDAVVPQTAGTSQRHAMRVAFFAGASCSTFLLRAMIDSHGKPELLSLLNEIAQEIREFADDLEKSAATVN